MKIIRPSTIEVTCELCKAVLAVDVTDIHTCDVDSPALSCFCADCGNCITLRHGEIPSWWISKLYPEGT